MLMMTPPPLATISRAAAWATRKAALTLSPSNRSRVTSSTSRNGCGRLMPALLTRMSSRPRPAKASRAAALSVTSNGSTCAFPPPSSIFPATSLSSLGVRLTNTSSAPAAANANAMARPIPRPAPVTSAVLLSSRKALSSVTLPPDLAGIRFQKAPHLRAGLLPPVFVEFAELRPEAHSVGRVDLHAAARELVGTGGVDLLDVGALQQCKFFGIALDDLLDGTRQSAPGRRIGEQREARPPMCGQAQVGLHLVELQRQYDAERIALTVELMCL